MASQKPQVLETQEPALADLARQAVELGKKKGAADVAAVAAESRSVEVAWRDGKLEQVTEATTRALSLEIFVDGRYSMVSTSDLRPEAIDTFLGDAVALARVLAPDPHRQLPEPALYAGRSSVDLEIDDPAIDRLSARDRQLAAKELVDAARGVDGAQAIQSVTGGWGDDRTELVRVTSNGFEGRRRETSFSASVSVSVKDADGRRPEEYAYGSTRFRADLPALAGIGREGAQRALARLGQKKGKSEVLPMAVENRSAGRLLSMLLGPLSGAALQQKRSFLDGKLGQTIGSAALDLTDEPLRPRGLASRHFDGEGITTRARPVFEKGALRTYYVDTYYGRKLGVAPTTAGASNLIVRTGTKGLEQLLADLGEGVLVTGFLGGNNNAATGDYSLGVAGFRVRKGRLAEPIGEMNIGGNQMDLWKRLAAAGNDPFPYSRWLTPTLVFDGVQFAGV